MRGTQLTSPKHSRSSWRILCLALLGFLSFAGFRDRFVFYHSPTVSLFVSTIYYHGCYLSFYYCLLIYLRLNYYHYLLLSFFIYLTVLLSTTIIIYLLLSISLHLFIYLTGYLQLYQYFFIGVYAIIHFTSISYFCILGYWCVLIHLSSNVCLFPCQYIFLSLHLSLFILCLSLDSCIHLAINLLPHHSST